MSVRSVALALGLILLAGSAQAEIVVGGVRYSDSEEAALRETCRGLDAQSRMSLISNVPDDIESADPSSEWALKNVSFTVRDCREAGLL